MDDISKYHERKRKKRKDFQCHIAYNLLTTFRSPVVAIRTVLLVQHHFWLVNLVQRIEITRMHRNVISSQGSFQQVPSATLEKVLSETIATRTKDRNIKAISKIELYAISNNCHSKYFKALIHTNTLSMAHTAKYGEGRKGTDGTRSYPFQKQR